MIRFWIGCGILCAGFAGCSSDKSLPVAHDSTANAPSINSAAPAGAQSGAANGSAAQTPFGSLEQALQIALDRLAPNGGQTPDFERVLQQVISELPELTVSAPGGPPEWNQVTLNSSKLNFDAFRFRSPLDVPADLHWVFSATPKQLAYWYILPAKGRMMGFEQFEYRWNVVIDGVNLAPQNQTFFQDLTGGLIEPGQEYIVWFRTYGEDPIPMDCALRLSPANSQPSGPLVETVPKAVGFEYRYREYEPTAEGLEQARHVASSLVQFNEHRTAAFARTVQSVAAALPEVSVSSGPVTWNQLEASPSNVPFLACRFTSPLDTAADLHWVFAAPGELIRWGVLPVDPAEGNSLDTDSYRPEVNLQLPDHSLPADNTVVFQTISGGKILPGHQYILWFCPYSGPLPEVELALRLAPGGTVTHESSAQDIAASIGLEVPAVPGSDRVTATLARCEQLRASLGVDLRFVRYMQSILPAVPEIEVSTPEGPITWNKLALKDEGAGVSVYRIRSPLAAPAGLDWAFVRSPGRRMAWQFFNAETGKAATPTTPHLGNNLQIAERNLPEPNEVVLQSIPGSWFEPGQTWLLWLVPEGDGPLDLEVAVRLDAATAPSASQTVRAIARRLGLIFPVAPTAAGGKVLEGHLDVTTAVCFAVDTLYSAGLDGTVRHWDSASGEPLGTIGEGLGTIKALAITADGLQLAAGSEEHSQVFLWNLVSGQRRTIAVPATGTLRALKFSPDGRQLAVAFGQAADRDIENTRVTIWNLAAEDEPLTITLENVRLGDVLFTPDGAQIVTAGMRGEWQTPQHFTMYGMVHIWDTANGQLVDEFSDPVDGFRDIDLFSVGEKEYLVTASDYGVLKIFALDNKTTLAGIAQDATPRAVSASPDGRYVAVAGMEGGIHLWDTQSGRIVRRWPGHPEGAFAVAFSPDGRTIASAGADTTVRVYDPFYVGPEEPVEEIEPIVNTLGMRLVPIAQGTFLMGTEPGYEHPPDYPYDLADQRPQHPVTISRPFYLAQHEVTVEQFRIFVEATGYKTSAEKEGGGFHWPSAKGKLEQRAEWTWRNPGFAQDRLHPVVQVSWEDAVAFCRWLGTKENAVYRLPTEAEWELACRAGSTTSWSCGNTVGMLGAVANVADESAQDFYKGMAMAVEWNDEFAFTAPVGSYLSNPFGLCDMHGNVSEWCADWYDADYYRKSKDVDPPGGEMGTSRVTRGGNFLDAVHESRSATRTSFRPDAGSSFTGFRVVREVE